MHIVYKKAVLVSFVASFGPILTKPQKADTKKDQIAAFMQISTMQIR